MFSYLVIDVKAIRNMKKKQGPTTLGVNDGHCNFRPRATGF